MVYNYWHLKLTKLSFRVDNVTPNLTFPLCIVWKSLFGLQVVECKGVRTFTESTEGIVTSVAVFTSVVLHNLIKCKHGVSGVHKLTCKTVLELCVCNVTWECARALGLSLALMHRKELRSALLSACLSAPCTSRQLISTTNRGHCVM